MCQRVTASSIVIRVRIRVKKAGRYSVEYRPVPLSERAFEDALPQNKYAGKSSKAQIIGSIKNTPQIEAYFDKIKGSTCCLLPGIYGSNVKAATVEASLPISKKPTSHKHKSVPRHDRQRRRLCHPCPGQHGICNANATG